MVEPRYYEYGTSPRKRETITTAKKPNTNSPKKNKSDLNKKNKEKLKMQKKVRAKTILYLIATFSVLFCICYRYSLINEEFKKLNSAKTELSKIQKDNEALKSNIENSVNLTNIEKIAMEKLGMQKLDKSQMVYISLEKEDYCETETENIIDEEKSIIEKVKENLFE